MFVTSSSSSNILTNLTGKSANRHAEMFALDEHQTQDRGKDTPPDTPASGDAAFGAKLASMFLVPERPDMTIGQGNLDAALADSPYSEYEQKFMELADKTLAERIRAQYLEDRDLTEAEVDAMSPEDREALEAEIGKAILEAMGINAKKQVVENDIDVPFSIEVIGHTEEDDIALQ